MHHLYELAAAEICETVRGQARRVSETTNSGPARFCGLKKAAFVAAALGYKLASVVKPLAKNPPGKS